MGFLTGIPCAEDVEKKITDFAVGAIIRGLKYMFYYKSLVKDFDTKIEKLNNEKEKISRRIKEEEDNGKIINEDVLTWQTDVEEIQKKDKELSPSFRCIQCLPIPNPVSRLRLGREAVKKSEIVTALTASGMQHSDKDKDIAYLPQPSEDVPNTNTVFQDFPSRQEAYGKLWNQLVSEDSLILGIYGMPGVGKTLMMEQLWKEAQGQKTKIFDKVTKTIVGSVTYDVIKLQDQLASDLKCNLESIDDKKNRADQLKRSMMNSGKILVIFDDVWGEISLYDIIGTSFGTSFDDGNSWKGCKILYTSRLKSHCLNNKCKDPVQIKKLNHEEALDMFKNISLGTDQNVSLPDESMVQKVCKKCSGLPLVIHAVGKALKFKTRILWEDALQKLEDCEIENIDGINPEVYACLKLSFDNLHEDAKQCLLLCSLLPANKYFFMATLVDLAAGSQLARAGRTKLCALVDTLKSASLLLEREGVEVELYKLHDIIRDVARSIAVKEHAFFFERCGRELPGNSADYGTAKVLHFELEKDGFQFPPDMVCPDLHTIWLVATYRTRQEQPCIINIPKFPGEMLSNIRLLVLKGLYWQQQLYLQPLNKLKTLMVFDCNLVHADATCFPQSLETLAIWRSDLPAHLDFAKLINLRKLKIYGKNELQTVPNTISSLSYLEILHLHFPSWDKCPRTLMPKFNEISKLTCLTSLRIYWSDFEPSQDTSIFCKLNKFNIRVGVLDRKFMQVPNISSTKRIELSGKLQYEGFQNLVERAELVILRDTDVNISKIWNSNREAFEDLRVLLIDVSDTIEYLLRISLSEIQSIPRQQSSFSKVTSLIITGCCAMKYLFNNFAAEGLVQLQEFHVSNCEILEVIVMNEGKSDGVLTAFSKLKVLRLLSLSNLKSFYGVKKDMHSSSTSMMDNSVVPSVQPQRQPLFDGMVAFPSLELLEISGLDDRVSDIWGKNYCNNDNLFSFWKVKSLKLSMCSGLKNVFQHSPLASHLIMHLKEMTISSCNMIREIIGTIEQEELPDNGIIVFSELTKLELVDLPKLSGLWCCQSWETNTYKVKFPALVKVILKDLEIDLEALELGRNDSTCQLEQVTLSCNKKTQLPSAWQPQLYDLKRLTLRHCFSDVLISLCFFRRLKFLKVTELECSTLFSLSVLTSLKQLQVLKIFNCSMLEEIVEATRGDELFGTDRKAITLFNLEKIVLRDLPNLKSFFHGTNYELHTPVLKKVKVYNCGLSTLFVCSVFQKLQQLEYISVHKCRLLEAIVAADERDIEASNTNDKTIAHSALSKILLGDMPNLKCFSFMVDYSFNMPKLRYFDLNGCPLVEYFTSLKTSTGLVEVSSEWHDKKEVPDRNDYIRQYRKIRDSAKHQPLEVSSFSFAWSCPWAY